MDSPHNSFVIHSPNQLAFRTLWWPTDWLLNTFPKWCSEKLKAGTEFFSLSNSRCYGGFVKPFDLIHFLWKEVSIYNSWCKTNQSRNGMEEKSKGSFILNGVEQHLELGAPLVNPLHWQISDDWPRFFEWNLDSNFNLPNETRRFSYSVKFKGLIQIFSLIGFPANCARFRSQSTIGESQYSI